MPHTNWMLHANQKLILIPVFQMMMAIWKLVRYDLFRSDHPSNTKQGGICIYHRSSLPLIILGI